MAREIWEESVIMARGIWEESVIDMNRFMYVVNQKNNLCYQISTNFMFFLLIDVNQGLKA